MIKVREDGRPLVAGDDREQLLVASQPRDAQGPILARFLGEWPPLEQMMKRAKALIDMIRDRRIDDGFDFGANRFQSLPSNRENIMGAAQAAFMAIASGRGQPGDTSWASGDPERPFAWIIADKVLVPKDAGSVVTSFRLGSASSLRRPFYARHLKDAAAALTEPSQLDARVQGPRPWLARLMLVGPGRALDLVRDGLT